MSQASQVRTYDPAASVVFLKTNERFGGLSNMAPGFPLRVNGVSIRTSEALYQACRFPHLPEVQRKIIDEHSPMTAKMRSKPFRKDSRPDWDAVRTKIMRWCLRVKLAQNWREFGRLLLATGDRPIVEQSRKDDFWGAKVAEDGSLVGMNVLGRLLMQLREQLKDDEASLRSVEPLAIPEFLLLLRPIEMICAEVSASRPADVEPRASRPVAAPPPRDPPQPSLFDQPMIAKGQMDTETNRAVEAKENKNPRPYSGYRDSSLPWLGRIPEHWDVRRNGRLFAERNQTGFEDLPILEVSLRTGVRVRDMENGARKQQMTDRSKYKRAAKGDIAYNMMRMWQGAVGVAPVDGLISPAYVVARPFGEVEPRYYAYLFRTDAYMREVNKFSRGIVSDRNRLYWDEFKQMPSVFPPTDEQARISEFLDVHGRLTARLIRNKRRLIRLLNEQKQAIINLAVTRGLNPDAPMKPTGIDWMPAAPAHWEAKRLKYLTKFLNGIAFKPSDWKDTGVPIIRIENLNGSELFNYTDRTNLPERMLIQPGDLVFAWSGNRGTSFGPFQWARDFPAYLNQHIFKLEGYDLHRKYFYYLLRAVTKHVEDNAHGIIGLVHITKPALGALFVPLAPTEEQAAIADKIDEDSAELNQAIEKIASEIRLIGEYRERIVADVVTGKLDVRNIKIAAPTDEPLIDESEDLEEELEADDTDMTEGADADD